MKKKEPIDTHPIHKPPVVYNSEQWIREKEERRKSAEKMRKKMGKIEPIIETVDGKLKKVGELNYEEQQMEVIRCASDPIYFIETYLTIFDQTQGDIVNGKAVGKIVPFKLFFFQKDLINDFLKNEYVITNKYRQAGVTTTTCAYVSWYIMFNENRAVALVADKLDTARDEVMHDVVTFIESCPVWLKPKTGKAASKDEAKYKDTQRLKRYDNGSSIAAFSSKGLRGYTPTLIFWDEVAWTEKSDKFWTSAYPTLQTGGSAILVSTPNGLDPTFFKIFDSAKRGDNEFKAIELWWFNDPRYNQGLEWIKKKGRVDEIKIKDENWENKRRIQMFNDGWYPTSPWFEKEVRNANGDMRKISQEILCSFLGSGDNFIAEKYLENIQENQIKKPIKQEYVDLNMWIWEDPIDGEEYYLTIDSSSGHGEDFSTINIFKVNETLEDTIIKKGGKAKKIKIRKTKSEQVGEYYGKLPPQQLSEIAYQYGKKYNMGYIICDVTGGYGVQIVEKLFEMGYENIHHSEVTHKPTRDRLQGYIKRGQKTLADGSVILVDLIPGFFIGNNRASVLLEMQNAIHNSHVIIRSVRLLGELKTFVTVPGNRVADHKRSFHDDSIMGMSCFLYVLAYDKQRYKESKATTEKMLKSMMNTNTINDLSRKKIDSKPLIDRRHIDPNNPYYINRWLFNDLKKK